ncbi:MAG: Rne/Rng family ribonuclease [Deltaproteobacteria bacterium]|nr:Rne/Rng family ribonuclease [Deltaproteobacteria bacterium]
MDKILINAADPEECRVAILDSRGLLQEYYTGSALRQFTINNIYKAVVQSVEPAIQAAFVNFGSERNGFLQITDIHPEYYLEDQASTRRADIKKILRVNQPLLVQVIKEPSQVKGAALSTYISLAGRFVVLTPGRKLVGVSRKIENAKERGRLREMAEKLPVPEGCGYIVRTVAEELTQEDLARDLHQVYNLWEDIRAQASEASAPSLIYREHSLAIKILRDHFNKECGEILVDEPETFQKVQEYIKDIAPGQESKVKFHSEKRPIFARHQLEHQLESVHHSHVRLKNGGTIVISPTEALVSIDVNSGRGGREENLEDTAFVTNMDAAEEIARQLRLRDLGGVVVIDFIDMRDEKHRREVERKVKEASKLDKAKMDFGYISRFGLMELTRQRIYPPVEAGIYVPCPHCGGKGHVYTPESASVAFLRHCSQFLSLKKGVGSYRVKLNSEVADYVLNNKRADLLRLEERHHIKLSICGDPSMAPSSFDISPLKKVGERSSLPAGLVASADENGVAKSSFGPKRRDRDQGRPPRKNTPYAPHNGYKSAPPASGANPGLKAKDGEGRPSRQSPADGEDSGAAVSHGHFGPGFPSYKLS